MDDSIDARPATPALRDGRLDYDGALRLVMGLADFERSSHSPGHSSFHLHRIGMLMERLGNPHLATPTVHVAGTKGKGSTAAMVTSILAAEGHTVGFFSSPHLHSAVERIRLGMDPIARERFARLTAQVWPEVEWVGAKGGYGGVSTFEMLTAMAFLHFRQVGAQYQVIEVGLGGRLDSTNIVDPQVCVITSISLDHVKTLGDTVELIAREKAGIIKRGTPVVVSPQKAGPMAVIREAAARVGAPLVEVDEEVALAGRRAEGSGQALELSGALARYSLWTPLLGAHQAENARTAVAAVETLIRLGARVSHGAILRGLREVRWPGRMEVLYRGEHVVVADGAHNPYSMRRLVLSVQELFQPRRLIIVFGALAGHSAEGMIRELASMSPIVLAAKSRHPRAAPSDTIAETAQRLGLKVDFRSDDVGEATRRARQIAASGDLVLGTGSLSVAAEVIEEVRGVEPELYPYMEPPRASA